ncbi:hypothetical protein BGX27_008605 [Mortierella sp. AM989]|nr:hypothetical protein BGX27_008605 [Mortierella sp. AM989]
MKPGRQGKVYPAVWKGQRVVKKEPLKGQEDAISREIKFLKHLVDRHIIQYYADEEDPLVLIMEYAEGGDLESVIPRLEWEEKERIAGEIAHGLSYMHSEGIIHCDIKTENVLLTKQLEVKLCDLGSARSITDTEPCQGTLRWMAPELLEDLTKYTPKSDVYSLGLVMWAMASGKQPTDVTGRNINRYVLSRGRKDILDNVPLEYLRTMQICCDQEPERRPAAIKLSLMKYGPRLKMPISAHFLIFRLAREGDLEMQIKLKTETPFFDDYKMAPEIDLAVNSDAMDLFELGNKYFQGLGFPKDLSKAMELWQKAADQGCEEASISMSSVYFGFKEFKRAKECAQQVSRCPKGSSFLGWFYKEGYGVEKNEGEAHRCFYMAAIEGHSECQARMGVSSYKRGNYAKAVKWYRMALEVPAAIYNLGMMYYEGHGMARDCTEAERLFREAADHGVVSAMRAMSITYFKKKDYARAMEWALKAEDDPDVQNIIGCMYYSGLGVPVNTALALKWFQRSADKGNVHSEHALGKMNKMGYGTKMDLDKAIEYFRKADAQGYAEAACDLVECIQEKDGGKIPANRETLWRAMELGSAEAKAIRIFQGMDDLSD